LYEVLCCLATEGRLLIIDHHRGFISKYIFKYLHHEASNETVNDLRFDPDRPLGGANGVLSWLVFVRDYIQYLKSSL